MSGAILLHAEGAVVTGITADADGAVLWVGHAQARIVSSAAQVSTAAGLLNNGSRRRDYVLWAPGTADEGTPCPLADGWRVLPLVTGDLPDDARTLPLDGGTPREVAFDEVFKTVLADGGKRMTLRRAGAALPAAGERFVIVCGAARLDARVTERGGAFVSADRVCADGETLDEAGRLRFARLAGFHRAADQVAYLRRVYGAAGGLPPFTYIIWELIK